MKAIKFLNEVKNEVKQVSWPKRKETMTIVVVIAIVVGLSSLFFLFVDYVVYSIIDWFLNFGK